ncbi:hypothetical protein AAFF_G00395750 [Aldrovandia affinis]|uniref:Uncharacterized protein n=1 Tax=Aldrovandia affinis TaxID=143900 RepID=A0AAD7WKK5_9TELE|nr:hypothetical protein AAFF_G00395750 [Aldrovandia affinis]
MPFGNTAIVNLSVQHIVLKRGVEQTSDCPYRLGFKVSSLQITRRHHGRKGEQQEEEGAVAEAAVEQVKDAAAGVQAAVVEALAPVVAPEETKAEEAPEAPVAEGQEVVQEAAPAAEVTAPAEEITNTETEAPAETSPPEPEPVAEEEVAAAEEPAAAPEPVAEPEPVTEDEPAATEPESTPEPIPEVESEPAAPAAPEDAGLSQETIPGLQAEVEVEAPSLAPPTDAEELAPDTAVSGLISEAVGTMADLEGAADGGGVPSEVEAKIENGDCESAADCAEAPALEQSSESPEQAPEPAVETLAEECINGVEETEEPPKEQTDCELKKDWELPEPIGEMVEAVSAGVNQVVDLV